MTRLNSVLDSGSAICLCLSSNYLSNHLLISTVIYFRSLRKQKQLKVLSWNNTSEWQSKKGISENRKRLNTLLIYVIIQTSRITKGSSKVHNKTIASLGAILWMSLGGPAKVLIWTQINFYGETWKWTTNIPIQTDRAGSAEKNDGIHPNSDVQS